MIDRVKFGLLGLILACSAASPALAQKNWTGDIGGTWFQANNWSPSGVPAASDDVHINRPNQVNWPVVMGSSSAEARDVFLAHGQIGRLWVEDNSSLSVRDIDIGLNGNGAFIRVWGGGQLSSQITRIGLAADSAPGNDNEVRVTGAGSTWDNAAGLAVGHGADGQLEVLEGGSASTGALIVGDQAGAVGEVAVDGLDSILSSSGNLIIGRSGSGEVVLSLMGTLQAPGGIVLAQQGGSSGDLILRSAVAGLVDAPSISGGSGTARVILEHVQSNYVFERPSGDPVNLTGSLTLFKNAFGSSQLEGTYNHTGGTAVFNGDLIFHGAELEHPAAPVVVGQNSGNIGALIIRQNSSASVGPTWVGFGAGSFGNLLINQSSELTVNGALVAGQNGTAFVSIGASQLNAGAVGIGTALPAGAQAEITVSGANALLNSAGLLQLGGTGQGSARLEVLGGGRVMVGSNLVVNSSGGGQAVLVASVGGGVNVDNLLNVGASAELQFGIDQFAPGWVEAGSASIASGASLTVELTGGAPEPGEVIVLIDTKSGISGSFSSTSLPTGWSLEQTANQLRLVVGSTGDVIFSDRFQ